THRQAGGDRGAPGRRIRDVRHFQDHSRRRSTHPRQGWVLDVSAGFINERQSQDGTITQARLHHVTLTPFPAYRKAEVVEVRDNQGAEMPEATETAPAVEPTLTVEDLNALQERQDAEFAAIRETLNQLQASMTPAVSERSLPNPFD